MKHTPILTTSGKMREHYAQLSASIMKRTLSSLALVVLMAASAIGAEQWAVFETSFTSAKKYENPFVDVEVDVVFKQGDQQWKVPAFWAGGRQVDGSLRTAGAG